MTFLLVLAGIALLLALWGIGIYNRLVALRNQVKNAWSQIDVQLQRRYDLIPNLVESVKGYMNFEKGTLEAVINARNQANTARQAVAAAGGPAEGASIKELAASEGALRGAMMNFNALAENYPQLKASENMKILQEELSSTENKVAFSRQAYNDQVMAYNTAQQELPASMFAATFGHSPAELFVIDDVEAKKAVKVNFS
ncbi:MAG: LemA family protein [Parachlamydiaceae bacterium]|nr:LemA family protein [Parachlamydiaceae bacterium]